MGPKMNSVSLLIVLSAFAASAAGDEVARKPKLFFVSTSATTTTLQTASICYLSTDAAYAACTGRKRRAITTFSEMETEVQPKQDEVDSSLQEAESAGRDGRFLLYWIPTTSISTSTSYTVTYTVSSVGCTPASGGNDCGR